MQPSLHDLFELYGIHELPENIMPMSIHYLGNSSVATVDHLIFDMIRKGKLLNIIFIRVI
jgi:3-oxoacyl-[acyl-carrier-protein] synthase-3